MGTTQELTLKDMEDLKLFDSLDICRSIITAYLSVRGPDPLTEDWRVVPEFPNYRINRCGEILNERGDILTNHRITVKGNRYDKTVFCRNSLQYTRGTDGLLVSIFKEDYI